MAASTDDATDASGASGISPLSHYPPPHPELRRVTALRVPLLYLQAATLPPVDCAWIHTAGSNFRLVHDSWRKRRAQIDRTCTADGRRIHADGSVEVGTWAPREFPRHRYPVSTLLTVDNPLPTDAVLFAILSRTPVNDSEADEDDLVRVLAGEKVVGRWDALATRFYGAQIARHVPGTKEAVAAVLRDMKPTKITFTYYE